MDKVQQIIDSARLIFNEQMENSSMHTESKQEPPHPSTPHMQTLAHQQLISSSKLISNEKC